MNEDEQNKEKPNQLARGRNHTHDDQRGANKETKPSERIENQESIDHKII